MGNLELCPKCQKGYLKSTGQPNTAAESTEPFRETGSMRIFVCDNDDCGTKIMKADKK